MPGPQGPAGPPGPVGPSGAAGPIGVYWSEGRELIPAGSIYWGVVASCDEGDFATGAGWVIDGEEDDWAQLQVVSSLPEWVWAMDDTSEAWQVGFARVAHDTSVNVSVYVQCLDLTP